MSGRSKRKICSDCGKSLPASGFNLRSSKKPERGFRPHCRDCQRERNRAGLLWARYRIRVSEYDEMVELQGGLCAICGRLDDAREYLSVDHCHTTGEVRGLLCSHCNLGLGKFSDDPETLRRAIRYLRASTRAA